MRRKYTEQTKKALKLCYEAHAGQEDKSGLPYAEAEAQTRGELDLRGDHIWERPILQKMKDEAE